MCNYFNIGKVKIKKTAAMAPMADAADTAFRIMTKKFSAAYTVGEMTSAKGLLFGDRKTTELLKLSPCERPSAVQLFGNEPDVMAKAVDTALKHEPDIIDINCGCPVNKIVSSGGGCAMMKTPEVFEAVIKSAVKVSTVPVTVKIRTGWDSDSINCVELAKIAEAQGVSAITVHGRTRMQFYSGKSDWSLIAAVKEAVNVPVIGNGDVTDAESAVEMYKQTGCDLVMIGRAALGRPWIFREVDRYIEAGEVIEPPTLSEKLEVMKEHIELAVSLKGERVAMKESRKHAAWYIKGVRGAAAFRNKCMSLETLDDLYKLIEEIEKIK
jgi:tRNA-dihydrouridine synthase B